MYRPEAMQMQKVILNPTGAIIFLNLSLNRKEAYLGEHIVATVKIYTRVNLSGINEIKYPPFTVF